ncbi:Uncharacterised protein [Raoultella planticola]|uniref:Uncharacterized protein n=1 Tax=Raoultella planticola TaxID=575 RepID=A0A485ANR6_RAOPL|nr:Uncharacterised protein [Raoultella planticola]
MWIESLPALVNEMSFLIKGSPAIAVIGGGRFDPRDQPYLIRHL